MCDVRASAKHWQGRLQTVDGHFLIEGQWARAPAWMMLALFSDGQWWSSRGQGGAPQHCAMLHHVALHRDQGRLNGFEFGFTYADLDPDETARQLQDGPGQFEPDLREFLPAADCLALLRKVLPELYLQLRTPEVLSKMQAAAAQGDPFPLIASSLTGFEPILQTGERFGQFATV